MDKSIVGKKVQLHPGTDRWMMGDRFGEITKVGRIYYTVHMDVSGKNIRVQPENIGEVYHD